MEDIASKFFGNELPTKRRSLDKSFERFGLDHNPFPPNRTIVPEVLYGQTSSIELFRSLAKDVLMATTPTRRALAIIGNTGGGKTHFLKHCKHEFMVIREQFEFRFAFVEFTAGYGKLIDLIREIYRVLDDHFLSNYEADFINTLITQIEEQAATERFGDFIESDDLKRALGKLISYSEKNAPELDTGFGVFARWVRGETLTQTERKQLNVFSRIATASAAIKVLTELLQLARKADLLDGIVISIDEIESLFTKGLSTGQIQAFLQDLRFLYDEITKQDRGLSSLFLSASTGTGSRQLANYNYPVFQRLGYGSTVAELQTIGGVVEAIEFANTYFRHYNEAWKHRIKKTLKTDLTMLLSHKEIEEAFIQASARGQGASQGLLLDRLYRKAEEKKNHTL
jgi:hypothetical protein